MKKDLVVLGLILIFIGLIFIPLGINYKTKVNLGNERTLGESTNSWEVSTDYDVTKGNRLILEITPGEWWWLWFEPWQGSDFPIQADWRAVDIIVTDPNGGKTNITLYYVKVQTTGTTPIAQFFGATVDSDGGLEMEEEYVIGESNKTKYYNYNGKFAAIAKYSGEYRVRITNGYEFGSEPIKLELKEQRLVETRPYLLMVPVGGVILGFGIIIMIFGWRKEKVKHAKQIRRIKKS